MRALPLGSKRTRATVSWSLSRRTLPRSWSLSFRTGRTRALRALPLGSKRTRTTISRSRSRTLPRSWSLAFRTGRTRTLWALPLGSKRTRATISRPWSLAFRTGRTRALPLGPERTLAAFSWSRSGRTLSRPWSLAFRPRRRPIKGSFPSRSGCLVARRSRSCRIWRCLPATWHWSALTCWARRSAGFRSRPRSRTIGARLRRSVAPLWVGCSLPARAFCFTKQQCFDPADHFAFNRTHMVFNVEPQLHQPRDQIFTIYVKFFGQLMNPDFRHSITPEKLPAYPPLSPWLAARVSAAAICSSVIAITDRGEQPIACPNRFL